MSAICPPAANPVAAGAPSPAVPGQQPPLRRGLFFASDGSATGARRTRGPEEPPQFAGDLLDAKIPIEPGYQRRAASASAAEPGEFVRQREGDELRQRQRERERERRHDPFQALQARQRSSATPASARSLWRQRFVDCDVGKQPVVVRTLRRR